MRIRAVYPANREIEEKIFAKHGLRFNEVIELFLNKKFPPLIVRSKKEIKSRWRYIALGLTFSGKYLAVVFVMENKCDARVITARMMSGAEKRRYPR